ncbi:ABC transporter ATP-binding protein [Amycolatopsis sp. La24]|uniref:ATP-binding cassette domain-containing protein n=1 Tax=Amycolatopsis sp. La24 TaxID=3028304 RepID=UPI0023B0E780|nr:ABC transporter ATP-binding protein [Amycolatopsis sp. La24]
MAAETGDSPAPSVPGSAGRPAALLRRNRPRRPPPGPHRTRPREIPARLAGRYPAELSGGQRQRVAIARALVCEPKLIICDEVTSALDVSVQASVVELLRSLMNDGPSMIFVTHNLAVVRSISDEVVVLSEGRAVESGRTDQVLAAPSHPYTRSLLAATLEVPTS